MKLVGSWRRLRGISFSNFLSYVSYCDLTLAHRRRRKLLTFASLTVLLEMNFLNFFWRVEAFDAALTEDVINDSNLRQLCFAGVPEGKGRRALAWRLLLNFLPMERGTWNDFLHQQRQLYAQLIGKYRETNIYGQGFENLCILSGDYLREEYCALKIRNETSRFF